MVNETLPLTASQTGYNHHQHWTDPNSDIFGTTTVTPVNVPGAGGGELAPSVIDWDGSQPLPNEAIIFDAEKAIVSFNLNGTIDFSVKSNLLPGEVVTYDFEVKVSDDNLKDAGVKQPSSATSTDTLTVSITFVGVVPNGPPVFTSSGNFQMVENNVVAANLTATDPEGDAVVFVKSGGDDAALLNVSVNGVVSFVSAPDFETPLDVNADNVYNVIVLWNLGLLSVGRRRSGVVQYRRIDWRYHLHYSP